MKPRPDQHIDIGPPAASSRLPAGLRVLITVLSIVLVLAAAPLSPQAQSPDEALFNAVEVNDVEAVEAAIANGADLGAKNAEGMTPADVAVDLGHFRIAHLLLSKRTASKSAPRVTDKVKDALNQPRQRVAAPKPTTPDPKLSELVPPKKPEPEPSQQMAAPQQPAPPGTTTPTDEMSMPSVDAPAQMAPPAAVEKVPPPPMRPDDEIARSQPAPAEPMPAPPGQVVQNEDGFIDKFWSGLNNVITLGGLIGGEDARIVGEPAPSRVGRDGQTLVNPADRFSSRPASPAQPESDSAAGRMVDRMTGMVGGTQPQENEFGLPQMPVVPPSDGSNAQQANRAPGQELGQAPGTVGIESTTPGLAAPSLEAPGPEAPGLVAPGLEVPGLAMPLPQGPAPGMETAEIPGLAAPTVEVPETAPGLAVPVLPPDGGDPATGIPGLAIPVEPPSGDPGIEIPGLAAPDLPDGPAPPDPETPAPGISGMAGLDIPGLDIPGVAAPAPEVPGIIPPPSGDPGSIPALPPGLEPLPGSDTGQLRRPGGLVEPEDPTSLPPPGNAGIQERINRIDRLLSRNPTQNTERYLTPRGTQAETGAPNRYAPRTAPAKPPVTTRSPDPMLEIPQGIDTPRTAPAPRPTERSSDRDSPAEILRRARESEAVMREREIHETRQDRSANNVPRPLEPSGHQLTVPDKPITARDEPSTRMFERFRNLSENQYENEDVHGLPVVRQPIPTKTVPPRKVKDISIAGIPADVVAENDIKLQKLARFFRGDQEEEAGMKAPDFNSETRIEREALPRVIDNLIPENDPARGQVVDDKMLDLRGVELRPGPTGAQPGATPTRNGELDPNFIDRLSNVLGPAPQQPDLPGTAPDAEPGKIGLSQLDVPQEQMVKPAKPVIPDPWTMTVERKDTDGQQQTLGVTAISPEDGSEVRTEQGVVSEMVGRIRQLFKGPKDLERGPQVEQLDEKDRQAAAERLLSDALRDGAPTALPDQGQWPVTEVETVNTTPGVPPAPRPGVLTRTSLDDVILSLGESVTLENTLPPQQDGIDPLNSCVKKNRGTTLFCIEPVDWPQDLRPAFVVPTILYTGPSAITRYDQGSPSRFHALFESEMFEQVVAYYQARYGEPTEIWKRSIAPLAKPRMDNPTVTWRSRNSKTNVITVLEIRKFDDSRGGFPDINRGAVMMYHLNAPSIFPQVSSHELMRLRRATE